ncbi:MAG: riboflavin synthase [Bacteroidetes bacterium]|nr:riboflavin synthase [Bacteroidota bacterium]
MFTGIIEELGALRGVKQFGNGRRFDIAGAVALDDIAVGDSISVNGVCLTVTRFTGKTFTVEAVEETMKKSTLGMLAAGAQLNLERALRANGKLGGHFVQGHVDFISEILSIDKRSESWVVTFSFPESAATNIVAMGSIAIDGISLTVSDKTASSFSVSVIPHTWDTTLFHTYRRGTSVNIELDMIGKYVLNYLRESGRGSISEGFLKELGY